MQSNRRRGLTLIETVVVVLILSIVLALIAPAVQAVRENSRRSSCANNQRQLALAMHMHESTYRRLPATLSDQRATLLTLWQAHALPFMEQGSLFKGVQDEIRQGTQIYSNRYRRTLVSNLQCPSNPDNGLLIQADFSLFAFTDFCGVAGAEFDDGLFPLDLRKDGALFSQATSGLSNTLMFGERPQAVLTKDLAPG